MYPILCASKGFLKAIDSLLRMKILILYVKLPFIFKNERRFLVFYSAMWWVIPLFVLLILYASKKPTTSF